MNVTEQQVSTLIRSYSRFTALIKEIKTRIYLGFHSSACLQKEVCVHQAIVIRKLIFFYAIWPQ